MSVYGIVPLTEDLVQEIAPRIRQADREEIYASSCRRDMVQVLMEALRISSEAYAGTVDGEPICAFGVAPASLLGGKGSPWMLGTHEIEQHTLPFLRRSRVVVKRWRNKWALLVNYVDARNLVAIQWLEWLGFEMEPAEPHGTMGLPFHRFQMRSDHV